MPDKRSLRFALLIFAVVFASLTLFGVVLSQSGVQIVALNDDAIVTDANGDGLADPGEIITYTVTVANCGTETARDVLYTSNLDPNTSLDEGASVGDLAPIAAGVCPSDDGGDDGVAPPPPPPPIEEPPVAVDDEYAVSNGSMVNEPADGVLTNDTGIPAPTVTGFGLTAATATANAPGDTISLTAGAGTIEFTLNADGSLMLDASTATTSGSELVFYTIDNGVGTDVGQITVTWGDFPVATDDTTANGVTFTTPQGTIFNNASPGYQSLLTNDALGTPPATLVSFGGGDLGGTVTDNAAPGSVTVAGIGTLNMLDTAGNFEFTPDAAFTNVFTFDYQIDNGIGTSVATVEISIEVPPVAQDDALSAQLNTTNNYVAPALFDDNGNGADDLGAPAATITGWGNIDGVSGDPAEFAPGATQALPGAIGGNLTVNGDGSFTVDTPTATGTFTFQYTLSNGVAPDSVATVTINVVASPVPADDVFTFLNTVDQPGPNTLFADNGNGTDDLGTPAGTIDFFGGGDLSAAVTDNAAGSTVPFVGGDLTINANGSWTLVNGPFTPGQYTFEYQVTNPEGSGTATVTLNIQSLPNAVDDDAGGAVPAGYQFATGATDSVVVADGVRNRNDDWTLTSPNPVFPDATIIQFGDPVTPATAPGTPYQIPGSSGTPGDEVEIILQADGSFTVDAQGATATPGTYQFGYALDNGTTPSNAVVTIDITEGPVAQDDVFTFLNTDDQNAPNSLFNDNGNGPDVLGTPVGELVSFDIGGGPIAVPSAGSATAALANGTLEVFSNGNWSLTGQPFDPDQYTFDYTLDNGVATSTATVTLNIQSLPNALDDDTGGAVPGAYVFALGTGTVTNTVALADGVRNRNDDWTLTSPNPVFPDATIINFGDVGSPLATTGTAYPLPGSSTTGGDEVTVTLAADGSFAVDATGATALAGDYSFEYVLDNGTTPSNAVVTIRITEGPVAQNDEFTFLYTVDQTTSNTLFVDNGFGADTLGNPVGELVSFDIGGGPIAVPSAGSNTAAFAGGTLEVFSNGNWSLTGQPFDIGAVTFDYTLGNGVATSTATVTLNIQAPPIANDDGTLANPAYDVLLNSNTTFSGIDGVRNSNDTWTDDDTAPDAFPDAVVTRYADVGDLGGPSEVGAGAAYVNSGVSVTIQPNGDITIDTLTTPAEATIQLEYELLNVAGFDTAIVTIRANALPTVTQSQVEENDPANTFIALPEAVAGTDPTVTDNPDVDFTFSEPVTFNPGAFSVVCGVSNVTGQYTPGSTPAANVTLTYGGPGLAFGETCTVTLVSDNIVDAQGNRLDGNADGVEDGSAADDEVYDFVVDTPPSLVEVEVEVGDAYTTVAGTFPGNGVTNTDLDTTIRLTFDETVNENSAVSVTCDSETLNTPTGSGLTSTGSGSTQLVLTRATGTFSVGDTCTIGFTTSGITDLDNADTPDNLAAPSPLTYEFELVNAIALDDTFDVTTHLTARFDTTAPGTTNLLSNDTFVTGSVTAVNGVTGNVGTQILLGSGAYLTVQANGDFDYTSAPGASATIDSFTYELDGVSTATVTINIIGPEVWFVDADATGPVYTGTALHPFADVTGGNDYFAKPAAVGETVFVYDSVNDSSAFACGVTLPDSLSVFGEGASVPLMTLVAGLTPVPETINQPDTTGNAPQFSSTGDCFTLGTGNTVRGLDVTDTTNGAAFVDGGATIGTATISEVGVRGVGSIVEFLNGGTLNASFTETSSTGSPSTKIHLVNIAGTLDSASGALNHATAATDMMIVSGGTVGGSIIASFNQTGGNAMLNINGGHTGTFLWSQVMTADTGSGLQFNNADGTYNITNTVTIENASAGINVENGSDDGSLNMTNGTSNIRGIQGIPFRINNSALDVTYAGGIRHESPDALITARVVEIIGGTGTIAIDGLVDVGTSSAYHTVEAIYLENTGVTNTISFGYVDMFSAGGYPALVSSVSGNISVDRFRLDCSGEDFVANGYTHCIQISDTTSSGVTVEYIRADVSDLGDQGGTISLINTPGVWTVENISGGLTGRNRPAVYGNTFGTLNIATVDSGTSPGGVLTGGVSGDNAPIDLTNGTVNINIGGFTITNVTDQDHSLSLVNVDGPLFRISGNMVANGLAGSNELIYLQDVSTTTLDLGTDGTTPANVTVNERYSNAFYANNVTSNAVNIGNFIEYAQPGQRG